MKEIKLTLREFFNFKGLANFIYEFRISNGDVYISAKAELLEEIGY